MKSLKINGSKYTKYLETDTGVLNLILGLFTAPLTLSCNCKSWEAQPDPHSIPTHAHALSLADQKESTRTISCLCCLAPPVHHSALSLLLGWCYLSPTQDTDTRPDLASEVEGGRQAKSLRIRIKPPGTMSAAWEDKKRIWVRTSVSDKGDSIPVFVFYYL